MRGIGAIRGRMIGFVAGLAVLLAGIAVVQAAPDDLSELGAPTFAAFTARDGLPSSVMASIAVDAQGFTWAASAEGLYRYDADRWDSAGALAPQGILGDLMSTHDGDLWVAFHDRGIARLHGGRWRFEPGTETLSPRRVVETLDEDGAGTVWAVTYGSGLMRKQGAAWVPAPDAKDLPASLMALAQTHTTQGGKRIWVGSYNQGLWYREGDSHWQVFRAPGFAVSQVNDLLVTRRGGREQVWVATFGQGLWRIDETGVQVWNRASGRVGSDEFYALAETVGADGEAAVWAGSRAGLVQIHGEATRVFDRSYGLPSDVIRALHVWRSPGGTQVLWLATENGIARTVPEAGAWQIVSLLGMRASGVFAVRVEDDGAGGDRLWVGASGEGLGRYQQGRWRMFGLADGLPSPSVRMIARAADARGQDSLWIGTRGGDLLRFTAQDRLEAVPIPWQRAPGESADVLIGREFEGAHELWVGTRASGLYRLRGGQWASIPPLGAAAKWDVDGVVEQIDATGRSWLWASGTHGLLRYDGRTLEVVNKCLDLPDGDLMGLKLIADPTPVLWLGAMHGIVRVDVSDPLHPRRLPNDLPAPPDPVVYGVERDSRGRLYLCTNNGVQQLVPTATGYASRVFTRRDGMPHDECNINAQWLDAHDRFWVGTLGGLGMYDPAREHADQEAKPLRVTEVRSGETILSPDTVTLAPGRNSLMVRYALLSWLNEDQSEFRTRLVGDEHGFTPWTHQNQRVLERLPPGSYSLQIEARDYAGNASEPVALSIRVQPAWWQTLWARSGLVVALISLIYLILEWRIRALKARQRQLEALVAERTGALHAANARLVDLALQDPLTGIGNRRKLHEALDEIVVRRTGEPCALAFVDVDHFKRFNDEHGHDAGDEALCRVASALGGCVPEAGLITRHGGEEFVCLMPGLSLEQARRVAECIRASVATGSVSGRDGHGMTHPLTVSIGIAERVLDTPEDAQALLRAADDAMYRAKQGGRNQVCD